MVYANDPTLEWQWDIFALPDEAFKLAQLADGLGLTFVLSVEQISPTSGIEPKPGGGAWVLPNTGERVRGYRLTLTPGELDLHLLSRRVKELIEKASEQDWVL